MRRQGEKVGCESEDSMNRRGGFTFEKDRSKRQQMKRSAETRLVISC